MARPLRLRAVKNKAGAPFRMPGADTAVHLGFRRRRRYWTISSGNYGVGPGIHGESYEPADLFALARRTGGAGLCWQACRCRRSQHLLPQDWVVRQSRPPVQVASRNRSTIATADTAVATAIAAAGETITAAITGIATTAADTTAGTTAASIRASILAPAYPTYRYVQPRRYYSGRRLGPCRMVLQPLPLVPGLGQHLPALSWTTTAVLVAL